MSHSTSQYSFFDIENQMSKIHQLNNFLCRLNEAVNWEMFRDALNSVRRERIPSQGGRPPFDVILMFKILVLKATYNLSDEATELFIRDRLSFREFLGLTFADTVPDARTIWLFAETLKDQNMERYLFDLYNEELFKRGFAVKGGCIMDGTFVEVPVQVCEKGVRNKPLTFLQRLCNNIKSRVRCRVEHVFGMQKKRMGDETLRTVGIQRANFWIGMRNLASNMCRCVCLNGAK